MPGVAFLTAALLLGVVCLPGGLVSAYAAENAPVRIHLSAARALVADPGTVLTIGLRVEGPLEIGFLDEELELPPEWTALLPTGTLTPSPVGIARVLAIQIPARVPAGPYTLHYRLVPQAGSLLVTSIEIPVEIASHQALTLEATELPDTIIAGRSLNTTLIARNLGNIPLNLKLTADPRIPGYSAHLDPAALTLLPGVSMAVGLRVEIPVKELSARTLHITVEARLSDQPNSPSLASVIVTSSVLPVRSTAASLDQTIPAKWTIRAVGQDDQIALQTEIRGAGSLTEDGNTILDFLFRSPDTLNDSTLGDRDEYSLRYRTPDYTLRAGDGIYTLSPLTSRQVLGRGGGVEWHPIDDSETIIGGFFVESRTHSPDQSVALYAKQEIAPEIDLQLNLTSIDEGHTELGTTARLISLQAKGRADEHLRFDTEYARGSRSGDGHAAQDAYRAELRGRWDGAEVSLQTRHADKYYPGPFSDLTYTHLAGTIPFSETSSFSAAYDTYAKNLDRSPEVSSAPREERLRGLLKFELPADWQLSLGYETFDRHDAMPTANFDTRQEVGTLKLGQNLSHFNWNVEVRSGTFADQIAGTEEHGNNFRFNLGWAPNRDLRYQLFGGYSDTEEGSLLVGGGNFIGATVQSNVTPAWALRLEYAGYNFDSQRQRRDQAQLFSDYTFDDGSLWSLAIRLEDTGADTLYPFMTSLTIPFDIPVGRRTTVGAVEGQIISANAPAQPGIPDVVITLGNVAAVSDATGQFSFPPLAPGDYVLDIDLNSLGLSQITVEELPMTIHIDGGKTTTVQLMVTPAAVLRGQFKLIAPESATEQADGAVFALEQTNGMPPNLGNIYLELSQGEQLIRRITDDSGMFTFGRLRPGIWHMQVYVTSLPVGYQLLTDTFDIELAESEQLDLDIDLLPRRREIRMQ